MSLEIPIIDLKELRQGNHSALASACESHGFFQLLNHGFSGRTEFLRAMKTFFALPGIEKQRLKRSDKNPWGFYDEELTKNKRDWKEIFDFGINTENQQLVGSAQWPEQLPEFQQVMLAWFKQCEQLSFTLLAAICETLGQPRQRLQQEFAPSNTSFLRLNFYPVCQTPAAAEQDQPENGHLGISPHTDAGALTVLIQDEVSGLQVRSDGQWRTVFPEPDALIINIGDLIQVWSNDVYKAPLHRVLANSQLARFSAPFFFNPAFSCECLPLDPNQAHHYRQLNWGLFRQARAAGDYANIGQESQISDYSINPPT